jgi:hypothetical protein
MTRRFEGEEFENPLAEPEEEYRPRREPRDKYQWQKTAAASHAPEHRFTCCGTTYGAMTPAALAVARQVHDRERHPTKSAPLALGQEV